ncbi:MAG: universal stress protein [Colwellia sp.]
MQLIKRILVVMDDSTDHQASLVQAIKIAEKTSASIELFLVVYKNQLISHWLFNEAQQKVIKNEYLATKLRWLETYAAEVMLLDINVSIDVVWHTDMSCAILAKIAANNTSMVIKSTKQDSTISKIFFTPSDWQLLEHCSVPLLLTKNVSETSYNQVMAAVDPEKNQAKSLDGDVLQAGLAMAELFDGQVHVCHCYEPIGAELWQGITAVEMENTLDNGDYNVYTDAIKQHHSVAFTQLLSDYAFDETLIHLVAGSAVDEIPAVVKAHDVDLLVMGMSNNGKYMGNTIEKILDNIECDVLSIKCLES